MPTKKKDHFLTAVRNALKQYTNPQWLGDNSPLATPYFLGDFLHQVEYPETAVGRGQALQQLLFQAAAAQWPNALPASRSELHRLVQKEQAETGNNGPCCKFIILELRYFRTYYPPRTSPTTVGGIHTYLLISESAFFRHLAAATEELATTLLTLAHPNLRLEQPTLTAPLVGRDALLSSVLQDLEQRNSVAFSGTGGIGKTSLATAVSQAWPSDAVFWYTFRPGLNDDLTSLLFALAHFLHGWGCSNLWLQLIAKAGGLDDIQQALGFLHEDISQPAAPPFLFCFDEVDLLHTGSNQPRHSVHKQLLELLEGLRPLVPLLLVGQRALIDTTAHYALQPLTAVDVQLIFEQNGRFYTPAICENIHRITGGNPRLVELYLALWQDGEAVDGVAFRRAPAIKPLFHRLWKRLSQDEKQFLASLSVFRSPAPQDAWLQAAGYADVQRRGLLKPDAQGGITLLPLFRELVYGELALAQRQAVHHQAAIIRATRGQHTAAAYHFIEADEVETAVQLWFAEQENEIRSGSAGAAHALFTSLHTNGASAKTAKQLKVIQNRLHLLYGEAEETLVGMDAYSWHPDEGLSFEMGQLTARGLQQAGNAHLHLAQNDNALTNYDDALAILANLSAEIVYLHVNGRGRAFLSEIDFVAAEQEILLAQLEIDYFQLRLKRARGQLHEAQEAGQRALSLAVELDNPRYIALAHYSLAIIAGNSGNIPTAQYHAKELFTVCERTGNRLTMEDMRAELAGFYLNVGRFSEAIEPAEQALRFFEKIKNSLRLPHIYSNLAEAYYETGQLDKAEQYAHKARNSENPHVQPYVCYTLGLIHQKKQKPQLAEDVFQFGLEAAKQTQDRFITAYLHRVYGSLLLQEERREQGVLELQTAVILFTEMGIAHEIEKTQALLDA